MKYCTYKDCEREAEVVGKTLCRRHYYHTRKKYVVHERDLHGMNGTSEYQTWQHLRDRCLNKNNKGYIRYGGRGIRVCQRWNEKFSNFYEDMGPKPSPSHSIDRIDNDKNYSCGKCDHCKALGWKANCRWADDETQRLNQGMRSSNKSGHKNVSWDRFRNLWAVRVKRSKRYVFGGRYATLKEAIIARDNFLEEYNSNGKHRHQFTQSEPKEPAKN